MIGPACAAAAATAWLRPAFAQRRLWGGSTAYLMIDESKTAMNVLRALGRERAGKGGGCYATTGTGPRISATPVRPPLMGSFALLVYPTKPLRFTHKSDQMLRKSPPFSFKNLQIMTGTYSPISRNILLLKELRVLERQIKLGATARAPDHRPTAPMRPHGSGRHASGSRVPKPACAAVAATAWRRPATRLPFAYNVST
jgi:hypothetical protein